MNTLYVIIFDRTYDIEFSICQFIVYYTGKTLSVCMSNKINFNSRAYFGFYTSLSGATSWEVLENLTQCQKPCFYNEYVQIDSPKISLNPAPENFCALSVWLTSPDTTVSTEVLLYHTENFQFFLLQVCLNNIAEFPKQNNLSKYLLNQ